MSAASNEQDLVAIAVPADVAAAVDARVSSGEFANQGEVVRDALRLLNDEDAALQDPEIEQWLRTVALPIAKATLADPTRSIPADAVHAHFAARRADRG